MSDSHVLLGVYVGVIFATSVIGVVIPTVLSRFRETLCLLHSLAAGTLFATAVLHLFPELSMDIADEQDGEQGNKQTQVLLVGCATYMLMSVIEKNVLHAHHHAVSTVHSVHSQHSDSAREQEKQQVEEQPRDQQPKQSPTLSLLARNMLNVIGISFHSIVAGMTLGSAAADDDRSGVTQAFVAIVSHKLFTAVAVSNHVRQSSTFTLRPQSEIESGESGNESDSETREQSGDNALRVAASWSARIVPLALFCLMTPLGAAIGAAVGEDDEGGDARLYLNAASAGTFLYMGVTDMAEEFEHHAHSRSTHHSIDTDHSDQQNEESADSADSAEESAASAKYAASTRSVRVKLLLHRVAQAAGIVIVAILQWTIGSSHAHSVHSSSTDSGEHGHHWEV